MNRLSKIVLALALGALAGLLLPQDAPANGRTFVTRSCHVRSFAHSYQAAYVAPVAAAVYYPVYGVGYQPDLTAIAANLEKLTALQETQQQILQNVIQNGGPIKQHQQEPPGAALLRRDCAKCHDSSVAAQRGGRITLFERGQFIDTQENVNAAIEQIKLGKMPKDKKWSGDDKYEAHFFLTVKPLDQPQQQAQAPQAMPQAPNGKQSQPAQAMTDEQFNALLDQRIEAVLKSRLPAPAPEKKQNGKKDEP